MAQPRPAPQPGTAVGNRPAAVPSGARTASIWQLGVRALLSNRINALGLMLIALLVLTALSAPLLAPKNPVEQSLANRLKPPGAGRWLGTDHLGRDTLSRMMFGARVSLGVGGASVAVSLAAGTAIGLLAAVRGGAFDDLAMRVMDMMMAVPSLLLGLMIVAALGSSLATVVLAISLSLIPGFARMARGTALPIMEKEYTLAARAVGAREVHILFRHVLPNIAGPLIVMASLYMAVAIRTEASLSFLGLGIQPPTPTWGNMIRDGMRFLQISPWLVTLAGLAIMVAVMALNVVGDGLRDAFDPRTRHQR